MLHSFTGGLTGLVPIVLTILVILGLKAGLVGSFEKFMSKEMNHLR